jgi:ketosteroid isomerase-like protein
MSRLHSSELSESRIAQIESEVRQAAIDHLHSADAVIALSHFTEDVVAASNNELFSSLDALAEEVRAYYDILKQVNLAAWDEMHFAVVSSDAVVLTAKFRFSFTSTDDERTDLQGVWTALYVKIDGQWRIRVRHESFTTTGN